MAGGLRCAQGLKLYSPHTMTPTALSISPLTHDWDLLTDELQSRGCAVLPQLLSPGECQAVSSLYPQAGNFRSRVVMARHGFGRGEYQYFSDPLPALVQRLRSALYPPLVAVANRWNEAMGIAVRYPPDHAQFLGRCHAAGQTRPTPLLLQYAEGDYNCLHQDLYGEHVFPLQVAVLLSRPGDDFTGGEFVLTEQRPRMQSRPEVIPPGARRRRGVCRAPPAGAGQQGVLQGQHAPRRQHGTLGPSLHAGCDFS